MQVTKVGCKSRSDCIDKCNIEGALKEYNSLPLWTKMDIHNSKDGYLLGVHNDNFNYSICENKYKSPDCIMNYYEFKRVLDQELNQSYEGKAIANYLISLKLL